MTEASGTCFLASNLYISPAIQPMRSLGIHISQLVSLILQLFCFWILTQKVTCTHITCLFQIKIFKSIFLPVMICGTCLLLFTTRIPHYLTISSWYILLQAIVTIIFPYLKIITILNNMKEVHHLKDSKRTRPILKNFFNTMLINTNRWVLSNLLQNLFLSTKQS